MTKSLNHSKNIYSVNDILQFVKVSHSKMKAFESEIDNLVVSTKTTSKERVYEKGHPYDFYVDLVSITKDVMNEICIMDAYVDEELINLYLRKIQGNVKIRILTNNPQGDFITIAKKYQTQNSGRFEVKTSKDCHDRFLLIDNTCWVTGQSIKDAGKKPTYLLNVQSYSAFRKIFEGIWSLAQTII